ncbi:nitrogen fixation protein NifM [Parasulfuritortus cantonensis]|uniref:peptidylprolyl isomerase n=1 Tax=Parasulfuritortus cantonensis TaxID=2528202 RepID=A0A4R1B7M9_9PROT|nr:nitrogen fixation protein NifM [Parasulfuritortus cantonensis]
MSKKETDVNVAYLVLKTANSLYGKSTNALSSAELEKAERLAARQFDMEARILASPEARDVAVPEATVVAALAEIRARYSDEEAFHADLAGNGLTVGQYAEALVRELRVDAILEKVASRSARVSEVDVDLYYQFHLEEFSRPEVRRARHILVTINEAIPENGREAARQRIDEIAARLARDPKRFEEQALKHSECPTAMQGGLLGDVVAGKLFPELEAVLFALAEGELSPVVESELGFHILRCDEIKPAGAVPLAQVRDKVREMLATRRRRICQNAWLKALG